LLVEVIEKSKSRRSFVFRVKEDFKPVVSSSQMGTRELWTTLMKTTKAPWFKKFVKLGHKSYLLEPEDAKTTEAVLKSGCDVKECGDRNLFIKVKGVGGEVKDYEVAGLMDSPNESSAKLSPGWQKSLDLKPPRKTVTKKGLRSVLRGNSRSG